MKKLLFFSAFAAIIAIGGCKKDDDSSADENTGITGKDWRMTASTITMSGMGMDTTVDNFSSVDPCEKDNLLRFNDDKTVTKKSGAIKCDPSEPDSENGGNWELLDNDTKIKLTQGTNSLTCDIITLNATTLSISYQEPANGVTAKFINTYTKN